MNQEGARPRGTHPVTRCDPVAVGMTNRGSRPTRFQPLAVIEDDPVVAGRVSPASRASADGPFRRLPLQPLTVRLVNTY